MVSKRVVYSLSTPLTDARIEKLSNQGGIRPLFVRDTRLIGFGLKVSPNEVKSFFVEARRPLRSGGGVRRVTLGRYPLKTLKEAREEALEALKGIKYGNVTASATGATKAVPSLSDVAKEFLERKEGVLRPSTILD